MYDILLYSDIMKMNDCINYLLSQAQIKTNQVFKENLRKYAITPAQYVILNRLWENDGLSPSTLSQLSGLDASTVTGLLTRMENNELIIRRHSTDDRRAVNVYLTDKSTALKTDVLEEIERSNDQVLKDFTEEQIIALKAMLAELSK